MDAGGLAAYGPRRTEVDRQRARQLVKIFHGAKPGDIPVEQPDRFELVINLRTAKAIGLEVPPALLGGSEERGKREPWKATVDLDATDWSAPRRP